MLRQCKGERGTNSVDLISITESLTSIFQAEDEERQPREKGRHNRLAQEKAKAARVRKSIFHRQLVRLSLTVLVFVGTIFAA